MNSSSVNTGIPNSLAFFNFVPAEPPAITKSVYELTDPLALPP